MHAGAGVVRDADHAEEVLRGAKARRRRAGGNRG